MNSLLAMGYTEQYTCIKNMTFLLYVPKLKVLSALWGTVATASYICRSFLAAKDDNLT